MKVKFVPQDVEFEIPVGQSVMHLAQDHGLYIKSVCKGVPSCAECRVRIVEGEHNVPPPGSEELSLIGTGHFIDRRRLSCQLKCFGDVTIDLTEQVQKQQGLIGKKTKRMMAKDDRVEQSVAIRSDERIRDDSPSGDTQVEHAMETLVPDDATNIPPDVHHPHTPRPAPRPSGERVVIGAGGSRPAPRAPGAGPNASSGNGGASASGNNSGANNGQPRDPNRPKRRRRRGGRGGKGGGAPPPAST